MTSKSLQPADLSVLSELAPELAEMLVTVASDIALVLDDGGVIQSVALGGAEPMSATAGDWVGRHWMDTVTADTRKKVEEMLKDVAANGVSRARHVNHLSPFGLDIPVAYTAIRLGKSGPLLLVGRDMRAVAAIQQRLVQTQHEMERDYWQRRHAETRYRFLFQVSADPSLIVDANTLCTVDANRAASRMFGLQPEELSGKQAGASMAPASRRAVEELLDTVRVSGRAGHADATVVDGRGPVRISVTPFSSDGADLLLMRMRATGALNDDTQASARLAGFAELTRDAIALTDAGGRVILANPAFVELAQCAEREQVNGRPLGDWLGGPGNDLAVIFAEARKEGTATLFATSLRGEKGKSTHVEVSAARIPDGESESFGFIIRVAHARNVPAHGDALAAAGQIH